MDVAVKDGKIAEVSPSIDEARSSEVISAKDRIVTPGFIDIHVHCYDGYSAAGVNAVPLLPGPRRATSTRKMTSTVSR